MMIKQMYSATRSHISFIIIAILLTACDQTNQQSAVTETPPPVPLKDFFAANYQQDLQRSPMTQTYRGSKDDYDKWDNLSESFNAETLNLKKIRLANSHQFDTDTLDDSARLSLQLYQYLLQRDLNFSDFQHHNYIMQQFSGWHTKIPSFLINMHLIANQQDAQDYISRLNAVPALIEQLIQQLDLRQQQGVLPPHWAYPQMLEASQNVLRGKPFDNSDHNSALLADFKNKIEPLALSNQQQQQLINDAKRALLTSLKPAYLKLMAALSAQQVIASEDDGIWKLPQGEAYYALLLNFYTTTDLSAEQIHKVGLQQVAKIHNEMQEIMKAVNFDGDLAAFFKFMRKDPQFYFPNTEQGRDDYLNTASAALDAMQLKLPEVFGLLPTAPLTIKRVEAFREKSAGKAFYQSPAQDGSRPGIYYANLFDMNSMPKYQLEALAYHEGLPGHHMQLAITIELEDIPDFQRYARFTAFSEGWGLYAEHLAKEMGGYQDPYSDFGRLAMDLWRACRLVVDTGIHAKRWNRQQAIDYLVANTPNAKRDAIKAIERYIVYPGQATAYMIGKLKILELRESAKTRLGVKFNISDFHDVVLKDGPMPLSLLESKINRWVDQQAVNAVNQ